MYIAMFYIGGLVPVYLSKMAATMVGSTFKYNVGLVPDNEFLAIV